MPRKRRFGRSRSVRLYVPFKFLVFLRRKLVGKKDPETGRKPTLTAVFSALAVTGAEEWVRASEMGLEDPLLMDLILREQRRHGFRKPMPEPLCLFKESHNEPQPVRRIPVDSSKRSE